MTPSSTDTEVLCSPPSLDALQQHHNRKQNKQKYEIDENNTERRRRDTQLAKSKKETPGPTQFEVKVVMGNRELSPGMLIYKITSGAPLESSVRITFLGFRSQLGKILQKLEF